MTTKEKIEEILLASREDTDPIDWEYSVKDIMDIIYALIKAEREEMVEKIIGEDEEVLKGFRVGINSM